MKRSSLLIIAVFAALSVSAQNKIDMQARVISDAARQLSIGSRSALSPVTVPVDVTPDQQFTVILTLDSDDSSVDLSSFDVVSRRGDMAIVRLKADQFEEVAAIEGVKQLSLGAEGRKTMDIARKTAAVSQLQSGTQETGGLTYTGKGVIAGVMDQGLDVNHINFLNADGSPRTQILWSIRGSNGITQTYDTPEKIKNFGTEMSGETHGTHVLGIMAGSYKGPAEYAFINSRGTVQIKKQAGANSAIPYYGVATEADLAVACGDFSGTNIETGVENIVNFAKQQGKPCVVNVSIGNTSGPHDGSDARSRWFASLGEEAIICVAAGNDGDEPVSISKTFAAGDTQLRSFAAASPTGDGQIEFWGADNSEFSVTFVAYNILTGEIVYSYKIDKNQAGKSVTIVGNAYNAPGYIHDSAFNSAFGERAALIVSSNISPANNRYCFESTIKLNGSSKIVPGFIVEGKPGQRVDGYANGDMRFYSLDVDGYSDGNAECSINGMGCGDNILVVGSYTNRESWPTLSGGSYSYNNNPVAGDISSFSSYGMTFDGRQLPDVCAPGGSLISSVSKYYIEGAGQQQQKTLVGKYTSASRSSYWMEMQGTSMATPFVAGVIASWLEADPTLTIDDVKDIIRRTADNDYFTAIAPKRWGAGKINALEGLKAILGQSGINDIVSDGAEIIVTPVGSREFDIFSAGAAALTAEIYSANGLCVAREVSDGDNAVIDASSLEAGIYIMLVTDGKNINTRKIVLQ